MLTTRLALLLGVTLALPLGCSDTPVGPEPIPEPPFLAEEVRFPSDGLSLVGTLTLPSGAASVPAVVIVPGSGPIDRDGRFVPSPSLLPPVYQSWAEQMSADQIAVLRYDKRFLTHSSVDPLELSQEDQIRDIVSAVRYLRSREEIDPARIYILGHSEGASLAPVAAARAEVRGVLAAVALAFPVDSLVLAQLRANPETPPSLIEEVEQGFRALRKGEFPEGGDILGAGEAYWREWILYTQKADSIALALRKPMVVIQGLADENLPGWTLQRNVQEWTEISARSGLVEFHTYPGVSHALLAEGTGQVAEPVIAEMVQWVHGN